MEILLWMVAGAVLGWMSYSYLGFNGPRGLGVAMVIGVVGALVGAKAIAPIFVASAAPGAFSAPMLAFAIAAAVVFLALANLLHQRWGV
jgi:uncharacterized membrane protein YeaQ/YmgE (transglycosylase-associated protein family)